MILDVSFYFPIDIQLLWTDTIIGPVIYENFQQNLLFRLIDFNNSYYFYKNERYGNSGSSVKISLNPL